MVFLEKLAGKSVYFRYGDIKFSLLNDIDVNINDIFIVDEVHNLYITLVWRTL